MQPYRVMSTAMRRSPRLEEALPVLYLRGLSTGDFTEALPVLLGPEGAGLSASSINSLTKVWQEEYLIWRKRSFPQMAAAGRRGMTAVMENDRSRY